MQLYQNRLETAVDTSTALASFAEWLGKAYSDPKARTQIKPTTEIVMVPVVCARGTLSATITAEVGTLDRASWDRANEDYKRNYNEYERDGKKGLMPHSPKEGNYYQRSRFEKKIASGFTCEFSIFNDIQGLPNSVTKDMSKAAEKVVRAAVDKSSFDEEISVDADYNEKAIEKRVSEFAVEALRPERGAALKGYDKIYKDDVVNLDSTARVVVREVPFIVMKYRSGDKNYAYAVDAVSGTIQVGTKPLTFGGKVAQAVATAAMALLIYYFGGYYVMPIVRSFIWG